MDVNAYLDLAKDRIDARSDRSLARALKMSQSALMRIRKGHAFPADQTMTKIAELAGEDVQIALLRLNIWRVKDNASSSAYMSILRRLTGLAATFALCFVIVGPDDAYAAGNRSCTDGSQTSAYYQLCEILRRAFSLVCRIFTTTIRRGAQLA